MKFDFPDFSKLGVVENSFKDLINDYPSIEMPDIDCVNIPEVIGEQLKPVIDKQNQTIDCLIELNKIKEQELQEANKQVKKSKIYNVIMLVIALGSLLATILIGVL